MKTAKIAISIEQKTLNSLDRLVKTRVYPSRSRAIQVAVEEKLKRLDHRHFERECSKLDPKEEQALAEEGFGQELTQWPQY